MQNLIDAYRAKPNRKTQCFDKKQPFNYGSCIKKKCVGSVRVH